MSDIVKRLRESSHQHRDAHAIRLEAADEITRLRAVSGVIQDDMAVLMGVLGISTHARDATPHEVMVDEVIPEARRLRAERDRFKAIAEENMAEVTRLRARVEEMEGALEEIQRNLTPEGFGVRFRTAEDAVSQAWEIARRALRGETDG